MFFYPLLHLFCFVDNLSAGLRGERAGELPLVVVRVGRVVVTGSAPIGFERLLDDLMAHESDVEAAPRLVHGFGCVEVVVGYVEPVSGFVCCHIRFHFVVYVGKDTKHSAHS